MSIHASQWTSVLGHYGASAYQTTEVSPTNTSPGQVEMRSLHLHTRLRLETIPNLVLRLVSDHVLDLLGETLLLLLLLPNVDPPPSGLELVTPGFLQAIPPNLCLWLSTPRLLLPVPMISNLHLSRPKMIMRPITRYLSGPLTLGHLCDISHR
jgi:hypothetical protein